MDKYLRPDRFDADPCSENDLSTQWSHWKETFDNFLAAIATPGTPVSAEIKYHLLVNHLSPALYTHIKGCDYKIAIQKLNDLFMKPPNEIYSRHRLMKRSQNSGESVHQYLQALKVLSKDCSFKDVTAEQNENDYVRDAFISGLSNPIIRQRLLENRSISLDTAYEQARTLELAQLHNDAYQPTSVIAVNAVPSTSSTINDTSMSADNIVAVTRNSSVVSTRQETCYFCGNKRHLRRDCPAADSICLSCGKKGHFAKVCRSKSQRNAAILTGNNSSETLSCITSSAAANNLSKATVSVVINNSILARALIDTGSTASFIDKRLVDHYRLINLPHIQ